MPIQKCPMAATILNFKMAACFHFKSVNLISFCNAGSFKAGEMVYINNETFKNHSLNMNTDTFSKMESIFKDGRHLYP